EILDDAVVHDRQAVGGVRMRVALARPPVGRPARMADADGAAERLAAQPGLQIAELAFGAAAREVPTFERRHAGGVVAAVLEPLERIDQMPRDRLTPEYADDPAHAAFPS